MARPVSGWRRGSADANPRNNAIVYFIKQTNINILFIAIYLSYLI